MEHLFFQPVATRETPVFPRHVLEAPRASRQDGWCFSFCFHLSVEVERLETPKKVLVGG